MEIFDISVPIKTGMVIYPGDPDVRLTREKSIAGGDPSNLSRLDFGTHSGTHHVDAPLHFVAGGPAADVRLRLVGSDGAPARAFLRPLA